MFLRFSATPGSEQIRPREGGSLRSPLAELGTAPVMRRGQRRAAVWWVGRGATARSREAEWRSGVAAVFWVCCNKTILKDPFGHYYDVRPTNVHLVFVIENGRKSDFRQAKKITTSSFDVPPYRDFVSLVIFHGGISRKIRTVLLGFEVDGKRRSAPRRVERSSGMRYLLGTCVRLVAGPARSSRSLKELSLSRSTSCLRRS